MKVKIGLEVHLYVKLENNKTKLFCSCPINYKETSPNTNICPRCTGMPGNKPMLPNKEAFEKAIEVALILNCGIPKGYILFQRKHYDWPDLPNGFQKTISGTYSVPVGYEGKYHNVRISYMHLEEDPAKWDPITGYVDYNRSGIPLIEIVTEPDLIDSEETRTWVRNLMTALSYVNSIDKDLGIKADVNVNIENHPRVEIKNVNSLANIKKAIEYEVLRQQKALLSGKNLVQETRTYDDKQDITIHMRYKEQAQDYMFIPEPDLPSIQVTKDQLERIRKIVPESPESKRERFVNKHKLKKEDAETLSSNLKLAEIFEAIIKESDINVTAKLLVRDLLSVLNYDKLEIENVNLNLENLKYLSKILAENKITENTSKKILIELVKKDFSVKDYIKKHDLEIKSDKSELEAICKQVIKENPQAVKDYESGEEKALNFLVGMVMKKTKGTANPDIVNNIIKKLL